MSDSSDAAHRHLTTHRWWCLLAIALVPPAVAMALVPTLLPLCALGLFSIFWWTRYDDLRLYAMVPFYPIPLTVLMLASEVTLRAWKPILGRARAVRYRQSVRSRRRPVARRCAVISGHSLKHLLTTLSAWWLLRMLQLRREC